jgi:hypothetical protein
MKGEKPVKVSCLVFAMVTVMLPAALRATDYTWDAGGDKTNWFDSANWSPDGIPTDGDTAFVVSAAGSTNVLLTNSTAYLSAFSISNAVLTFSNWTTALLATNVTIRSGGRMTHRLCATNLSASNSNRVYVICSSFTIESNGAIAVDSMGYPGGYTNGYGPGGGKGGYGAAGGYGGIGGVGLGTAGAAYGSATEPTEPGSGAAGGASWGSGIGGNGGGAVRIEASGAVLINGTISANGGSGIPSYWGGGSGGGIYITCGTFAGTNGVIRANGVNGSTAGTSTPGGGGGGRVAIICTNSEAQSLLPVPSVGFSANRALINYAGDIGTLCLSHEQLLPNSLSSAYTGRLLGFTNWGPNSLTINNTWIGSQVPIQVTVTNDLRLVGSSARLDVNKAALTVGGNLVLSNGATLHVYSGATNENTPNYGVRIAVGGTLNVGSNCVFYPHSDQTNGGSPFFSVANLVVVSNGQINANGFGRYGGVYASTHTWGYGAGGGQGSTAGGGGYGGRGAKNESYPTYGLTYGSSNVPIDVGSGGGAWGNYETCGGAGGGAVWMEIAGSATLAGTISANGGNWGGSYGGGGSGGSVYIKTRTFAPAQGTVSAQGGKGSTAGAGGGGGGGGGGRIALASIYDFFTGATNVAGGTGDAFTGSVGTVCILHISPPGTVFCLR